QALENVVGILAYGAETIFDATELLRNAVKIHVRTDCTDLLRIIFSFQWSSPDDRGYLFDLLIANKPMRNINHDVADSDDGHMFAHLERSIAETRQAIEMVDNIFCVEDAPGCIALNTDSLGALRTSRDHNGAYPKTLEISNCEILALAYRHVSKVVNFRLF